LSIPNIFHFVYGLSSDFGGKPFSFVHYLAIESARRLNKPDKIFFVCEYEPESEWFEKLRPYIEVCHVKSPEQIFGNPLTNYAHKSDVIRLQQLKDIGGVYLDIDTISARPMTDLRKGADFVIGSQLLTGFLGYRNMIKLFLNRWGLAPWQQLQIRGLCNAVLLSQKNSSFIQDWYDSYKDFDASQSHNWDYHSVIRPWEMFQAGRNDVDLVSPFHFHFPLWDQQGLMDLFVNFRRYPRAYLHHLWESRSWDAYMSKVSPTSIFETDSTYNCLARNFCP